MTKTDPDHARISAEAAKWAVRLERVAEPPAECRAEFAEWLLRSPVHLREFLCASALSSEVDASQRPH